MADEIVMAFIAGFSTVNPDRENLSADDYVDPAEAADPPLRVRRTGPEQIAKERDLAFARELIDLCTPPAKAEPKP